MAFNLSEQIQSILDRIEKAKSRSQYGNSVELCAVTKHVPLETIQQAFDYGLKVFGENRIEEALPKVQDMPHVAWHLIGHLQSRKVKTALPLFQLIHSVDSLKLIECINREAQKQNSVSILLEVNISGEESKYGFTEVGLWELLPQLDKFPSVKVKGLMTMAPLSSDPEMSRLIYRRCRELKEAIEAKNLPFLKMDILSMGMSQDFEVAIEEGATLVRVGRALFEGSSK